MSLPRAEPVYGGIESRNYIPMLFYTCANKRMHDFAILYPLFALLSNPYASVEICLDEPHDFINNYNELLLFYDEFFPGKILWSSVPFGTIAPNSIRFLVQPFSQSKYIYIGDIDIIILDDEIMHKHIRNIKYNNLDYSNVLRNDKRSLTGLHFIEYKKMYPIMDSDLCGIDAYAISDEQFLFYLMQRRGFTIPTNSYRPLHGLHASLNRAPLPSVTTRDSIQNTTPAWHYWYEEVGKPSYAHRYLDIRYTELIRKFMKKINPQAVSLRRNIQFIDMFCHYVVQYIYSNDFNDIYSNNLFKGSESISGPGSSIAATGKMRAEFSNLLKIYDIQSIVDIPCGDFNWMSSVDLKEIKYVGGDIVIDLIEANRKKYGDYTFGVYDLRFDALPEADLLLCRDCFIHLPLFDILLCLKNIRASKIRWCLLSTYYSTEENSELSGLWRPINLLRPPFNLPEPQALITERAGADKHFDKSLGLWDVSAIPLSKLIL
jgi:hypothetical protein